MRARRVLTLLGLVSFAVACAGHGAGTTTEPSTGVARYDGAGPHAVGVHTSTFGDSAGPVTIWYPADGSPDVVPAVDAPGATSLGPYPLFVFAHGLSVDPSQHELQLAHAASWGFVVAAPDRIKDVDLVAVADDVRKAAGDAQTPFAGLVDDDETVFGGFSQGTVNAAAGSGHDRIAGVLLIAGGGAAEVLEEATVPVLFLTGGRDRGTATWVDAGVDAVRGPKLEVQLDAAGHASFTTMCLDVDGSPPVAPAADCAPPEVGDDSLWPLIHHTTVAFLRWTLGVDETPEALDPKTLRSFQPAMSIEGSFADASEPPPPPDGT